MPLEPLPANSTSRLWVDYDDGVNEHTLLVRFFNGGSTFSEAMVAAHNVLSAFGTSLYLIGITGARWADVGDDISTPVTWTGDATYGVDPMPTLLAPRETRFLGRTPGGRKASWSFYGVKYTTPDTYRINTGDIAFVAAVLADLATAQSNGNFVGIDNGNPVNYPYANVNFNSYWEKEARA